MNRDRVRTTAARLEPAIEEGGKVTNGEDRGECLGRGSLGWMGWGFGRISVGNGKREAENDAGCRGEKCLPFSLM